MCPPTRRCGTSPSLVPTYAAQRPFAVACAHLRGAAALRRRLARRSLPNTRKLASGPSGRRLRRIGAPPVAERPPAPDAPRCATTRRPPAPLVLKLPFGELRETQLPTVPIERLTPRCTTQTRASGRPSRVPHAERSARVACCTTAWGDVLCREAILWEGDVSSPEAVLRKGAHRGTSECGGRPATGALPM